jgi:hypothetical protein
MQDNVDDIGFEDYIYEEGPWRIEWEFIGEGMSGEYDPMDNEDVALLRANLLYRDKYCEDGSYCTVASTTTPHKLLEDSSRALVWALNQEGQISGCVDYGKAIDYPIVNKRIMQEWTWTEYDIAGDRIVVPRNGAHFAHYVYKR